MESIRKTGLGSIIATAQKPETRFYIHVMTNENSLNEIGIPTQMYLVGPFGTLDDALAFDAGSPINNPNDNPMWQVVELADNNNALIGLDIFPPDSHPRLNRQPGTGLDL